MHAAVVFDNIFFLKGLSRENFKFASLKILLPISLLSPQLFLINNHEGIYFAESPTIPHK